jgi:hypothetical protein
MMVSKLRTLLWIAMPMGLLAGGCTNDPADSLRTAELRPATATIENFQEADYCANLVTIDGVDYAPDAASLDAINERELPPFATVDVLYRLTGEIGHVSCGMRAGHTLIELPEITIAFP